MQLAATILLMTGTLSFATNLSDLPVLSKSGEWSVRRWVDPMTDKAICTGFYKNRFDIQLNEGVLYISLQGRGGVSSVILRFDDKPAEPLRLASDTEKQLSSINISGSDFEELRQSKRLRARILTVLETMVDEDIDLTGLKEVYAVIISSQCQE